MTSRRRRRSRLQAGPVQHFASGWRRIVAPDIFPVLTSAAKVIPIVTAAATSMALPLKKPDTPADQHRVASLGL